MNTKICKVCKIEKEYSEFHKSKHSLGGVRTTCKECRKKEKNEYRSRPEVKKRQQEHYQKNKKIIRERTAKHYWTINGQFHQYKKRAKKSNIVFELNEKDCVDFFETNCYYCGDKINGLGIDRVDNKKGYVKDNIVPCCSKCNFMKHVMGIEEFIEQLKKIVQHLKL